MKMYGRVSVAYLYQPFDLGPASTTWLNYAEHYTLTVTLAPTAWVFFWNFSRDEDVRKS